MFKIIELRDDVLDEVIGGIHHQTLGVTLVGTTLTVNGNSQTYNGGTVRITIINGVVTIV